MTVADLICCERDFVMLQCTHRVGRVVQQLQNDVLVRFHGIERAWRINPDVLSPAVGYSLTFHHLSALFNCRSFSQLLQVKPVYESKLLGIFYQEFLQAGKRKDCKNLLK